LVTLAITGSGLVAWKRASVRKADAAAARQPEPIESVTLATARARQYRPATTAVGTILALNSITLRNELAGTVSQVTLVPGQVVEAGVVLVALDVSVEEAELQAQTAQADLAETTLARLERLWEARATSQEEVDQARAARDVALAQIARTRAIIARKTIRAPFRARVGLSDVHPGQYLNEGTELTTLQGVDAAVGPATTVFSIPVSALRKGPSGDHVFLIVADSGGRSRAHVQPVRSGPVLEDEVVILSGLTPGQQVATSGSFKLREAVLVAGASSR